MSSEGEGYIIEGPLEWAKQKMATEEWISRNIRENDTLKKALKVEMIKRKELEQKLAELSEKYSTLKDVSSADKKSLAEKDRLLRQVLERNSLLESGGDVSNAGSKNAREDSKNSDSSVESQSPLTNELRMKLKNKLRITVKDVEQAVRFYNDENQ
jgi:hypothetical protein